MILEKEKHFKKILSDTNYTSNETNDHKLHNKKGRRCDEEHLERPAK